MLQSLFIKDFIIIERLEVAFNPGFTAITGETGAGKSVFVGALSLLLGYRADSSLIRLGADKSIIEGIFTGIQKETMELLHILELDLENTSDCILRREISRSGRNRSFVNDTPVPLGTLKRIAERLIDIHSQHRNLLLGDSLYILSAVDKMLPDKTTLLLYQETYREYKNAEKELVRLRQHLQKAADEFDYDSFRFQEISQAHPKVEEEIALHEEEKLLQYADNIKEGLLQASQWLDGKQGNAIAALQESLHMLTPIAEHMPSVEEYIERLESCRIELGDIAADFMRKSDTIEVNPQRLLEVEERLDLLNYLLEKFHCASTQELIDLHDELQKKITLYQDGDLAIQKAEEKNKMLKTQLDKVAHLLTESRKKVVDTMEQEIKKTLKLMELPFAEVSFELQPTEVPRASGYDDISFLFAANSKLTPRPVGEIASGGEMSRLMLALKALLAQNESLPTILFDEIDTGISGRVADKMGKILRQMGNNMQVIAITHLPQIAARGSYQKHIEKHLDNKGVPFTSLRTLSEEERIEEVASLLSADTVTKEGVEAAKVLLKNDD